MTITTKPFTVLGPSAVTPDLIDRLLGRSTTAPCDIERPAAACPNGVHVEGKSIYINNKLIMTVDDPSRLDTIVSRLGKYTLPGAKITISFSMGNGIARLFLERNGIKEQIREEVIDKTGSEAFLVWANNLKSALGAEFSFPDVKSTYDQNEKKYGISINGNVIMSAAQKYISDNTVENLRRAMFSLEPGKKPVVSVKMRSIVNGRTNKDGLLITLYINDVDIRTTGIDRAGEMDVWAKEIGRRLNGRAELAGIENAGICATAAQHLGEKYVYGVNDCSYYTRSVFPALEKRTSPAMMAFLESKKKDVKGLPDFRVANSGDVIVGFVIAQKDETMPDGEVRKPGQSIHVFWAIRLGDGKFLFSENTRGGPRMEIRDDLKYHHTKLFRVNGTFVDHQFRTA